MITNTVVYSNEQMLAWVSYMSQNVEFNVEKVKLMNVCHKKKNVIPSVESNKRVLIFADETHTNLCYDMWKAGLGDCEVWYETGLTPQNNLQHGKIKDLIGNGIMEPTVLLVINQHAREAYRIGMKNENFAHGPIRYVGSEIRAVIMSMLHLDSQDTVCIVSGESIAIEAAIIASEGTVIAVENNPGSMASMEENADKFGVHNIEIIPRLTPNTLANLPTPRIAFIVASKTLESDIEALLAKNPELQIVIYTLELNILASIKDIFKKYNIENMEVIQIALSKLNSKSEFVTQPVPWLISGAAVK